MNIRSALGASILLFVAACGDESHDGHDGGDGGAAGGSNEATAPVLDGVEPMHGALHLNWTNTSAVCDTVEGERKRGAETEFSALFSVPGTVDNKADDAATDSMTVYTYRLRCKMGEVYSPYSNEMSATPAP